MLLTKEEMNVSDFMGGMFDFNGDGKTDTGERFIAYQSFKETGFGLSSPISTPAKKVDWLDVIIKILAVWGLLDSLFSLIR